MNRDPSISVIIPVFNGALYVRDAINSVLAQTFQDFEIIVVDDGSTDNLKDVINSWIQSGKVRYIYQDNKGLAAARNTGISLARGRYLKFLDCDDVLYGGQLERQADHLKGGPETLVSVTDYELEFEGKQKITSRVWLGKKSQLARFIEDNPCPVHVVLIHRDLVKRIGGFDEKLRAFEDSDLWLRALHHGAVFEKLDFVGCCYRILSDSLSSDSTRMFIEHCAVSEKLNQELLPLLARLEEEVVQNLVKVNINLIHTCFIRKVNPLSCLSVTLRATARIYSMKVPKVKAWLIDLIGIKNFILLQFLKRSWVDHNYGAQLWQAETFWRNESYYKPKFCNTKFAQKGR